MTFSLRLNQRGDTIIEVLLATAVLSVVLAGAYTLTNSATRINQQAYERTRVSNYLQEQAELIRSARDSQDPIWQDILANADATLTPVDCKTRVDLSSIESDYVDGFYLMENSDPTDPKIVYATLPRIPALEDLFYVWSEVQDPTAGDTQGYVNVQINACWIGIGQSERQQSGIVIRLEKSGL